MRDPVQRARGTVWRIKFADADGKQVMETVGKEADGVTRKVADAALRERLVRVERMGYRRPRPLTFGQYADDWFEKGQRSQGWKPLTISVYRNAIDGYLVPVVRHVAARRRPAAGRVRVHR